MGLRRRMTELIGGEMWKKTLKEASPTSGLVELQGDVSIEAQAEVVVEHVQRQLRRQEIY